MDIILGATGHVGSSITRQLLSDGDDVTVITHNPNNLEEWKTRGANVELVDVHETEKLRDVFKKGQRLFLLNPPADITLDDSVKEEKITVYSILEAVKGTSPEKIVAESTYGAQPGDGIGDLGVLYELEKGIEETGISFAIIRAAYYMTNWEMSLQTAMNEGIVYSLYPEDFKLPMVDPDDIGKIAADLLTDPEASGVYYVEGPEQYSAQDVANAFTKHLHRSVKVVTIEKDKWAEWLINQGFSRASADSMIKMTELTLEAKWETPQNLKKGPTGLDQFIGDLVLKNYPRH